MRRAASFDDRADIGRHSVRVLGVRAAVVDAEVDHHVRGFVGGEVPRQGLVGVGTGVRAVRRIDQWKFRITWRKQMVLRSPPSFAQIIDSQTRLLIKARHDRAAQRQTLVCAQRR